MATPKEDLIHFLNQYKIKILTKRNTKRLQMKIHNILQTETATVFRNQQSNRLQNSYMNHLNIIRQNTTLEEDSFDIQTLQTMLSTEMADQSRLAAERQSLNVALEIERMKRPTSTKSTYEGPQNEYKVLIVYLGMV